MYLLIRLVIRVIPHCCLSCFYLLVSRVIGRCITDSDANEAKSKQLLINAKGSINEGSTDLTAK